MKVEKRQFSESEEIFYSEKHQLKNASFTHILRNSYF